MSDNFMIILPENVNYVPNKLQYNHAKKIITEIASDADDIEFNIYDNIIFFDCGENFEQIICPSCSSEISIDWWQDRMGEDFQDNGFIMNKYLTPCCGETKTLQELNYIETQGFAKFAIEIRNTMLKDFKSKYQSKLEKILNTKLQVIYKRL
jgi:hypothetical protein